MMMLKTQLVPINISPLQIMVFHPGFIYARYIFILNSFARSCIIGRLGGDIINNSISE